MKNMFFTLALLLLIFGLYYFYDKNQVLNQKNQTLTVDLTLKEKFYKDRIDVINQYQYIQIKYIDESINGKCEVFTKDAKSFPLSKLFNKLVFYIPEGVCNLCYEGFYKDFNDMVKVVGKDNLIIIVPKLRMREMISEFGIENNYIINRVYGVNSLDFGLRLGSKHVPFMFILDNDLRAKNLFIPNKNISNTTSEYMKLVKERYFTIL